MYHAFMLETTPPQEIIPEQTVEEEPVVTEISESSLSEHEHELVDTALAAIDTLLNISTYVLTVLGIVLALIGIVGWVIIRKGAIDKAADTASSKLDSYLEGEKFEALLADKLQESIEKKWQGGLFINVDATTKPVAEDSPFPQPTEQAAAKFSRKKK